MSLERDINILKSQFTALYRIVKELQNGSTSIGGGNSSTISKTSQLINDGEFGSSKYLTVEGASTLLVQSDAAESNPNSAAYIKNFPSIPTKVSQLQQDGAQPIFASQLNTSTAVPPNWENSVPGITIADLQSKNLTEVMEKILFPIVPASLYLAPLVTLNITGQISIVEKGSTPGAYTIPANISTGLIKNGDGTTASATVVGTGVSYTVTKNSVQIGGVTNITPNSTSFNAIFTPGVITGNTTIVVQTTVNPGSGLYYNNRGATGNNISQIGRVLNSLFTITAVVPIFYGSVTTVPSSLTVSALDLNTELSKLVGSFIPSPQTFRDVAFLSGKTPFLILNRNNYTIFESGFNVTSGWTITSSTLTLMNGSTEVVYTYVRNNPLFNDTTFKFI